MSYPFLVRKGFKWDVMSSWHDFLEGVQGAVRPEEARAETANPAWSSSLAKWEIGLDAGFPGCLADSGWSVKNLNQNISLLTALRSQPWTRSLIYITVVFLHLVLLCLVCYMGDCLSMCENGYSMQSCCCDRIFGKWDPWLLQCWPCEILGQLQDCKCCVFNLHFFAKVCFGNFLCSSGLQPHSC